MPRRRTGQPGSQCTKAIILASLAILLAALAASAAWFRAGVPPGLRRSAHRRPGPPKPHHARPSAPATTLDNIRTVAGGWLALRFVCTADLAGFDPHALPPGTPMPGQVRYTSRLSPDRSRHEVTVELQPLLTWEQAQ